MRPRLAALALGLAAAGCFSKPDFRGADDVDAAADATPDAAVDCGPGLSPLPADFTAARRQFYSIGDLDRDGLHDLAIFGTDSAGGQHVYIYFGEADRDLDVACWDHELIAAPFFRLAGIRLEAAWHGDDNDPHGTILLLGLDAADHADVRVEELTVARDRTFGSPRIAVSGGLTAPPWADDATAAAAFSVWRFVESSSTEELFFGGGDKLFTVPMQVTGLSSLIQSVPNPSSVRVQQAIDLDSTHLTVDDGAHVYTVIRGAAGSPLTLPPPLDGTGSGAPDGDVYAAHDWEYANVLAQGIRVPRFSSPPARTTLQIYDDTQVYDRTLRGVTPTALGPFFTDAMLGKQVGDLGFILAAVITTFDAGGDPATQILAIEAQNGIDGDIAPTQELPLETSVVPVVITGGFRVDDDRNLLVIYPHRTANDPPTHSACYHAVSSTCLAPCAASTCGP